MDALLQDVRYGLRMLWGKPTFALVAILTLALGVGANTAIFSIVYAVLLRPLPYRDSANLVKITFNNPGVGLRDVPFSVPEFEDLKNRAGVFEEVSVIWPVSANVTGGKQPQRIELMVTSPNYFSMLGATPQIGRLYGRQDFAIGFAPSVVISDGLWRRSFGGDPNVLGQTLRIDNDPYTIVGVLPPGFRHPGATVSGDVEIWGTAGFGDDPFPKPQRKLRFLPGAIGRLKRGLTIEQAQARLTAMSSESRRDFASDYPPQSDWTVSIQSLHDALVGNVRPMLLVLLGAVLLIVFIVSLNIANLLLARASGRQQEMAVRVALGAGRWRMIRQMLTESMILSIIGGIAGVATAILVLGSALRFVPANIPRVNEVTVDWVVLGFALLISVMSGLLFGLAPAIQASRSDVAQQVREGARGIGYSSKTTRIRDVLIISELAVAVVLMVGAGLLLRTFYHLLKENPGFNPSHVVTANIWLPAPNNPKADPYLTFAQQIPFKRELLRRMSGIPGVAAAGITSNLPTSAQSANQTINAELVLEDRPAETSQDLRAELIRVSPDYFSVMQAPLLRGRVFSENDEDGKPPVVIIDETTARRFWGGGDPLEHRVRIGPDPTRPWMTVVGIVKDIKHDGLDVDGVPHIYLSMYQSRDRALSVVLRTSLPAYVLEPEIRSEIQKIDSGLPVFNVTSMNQVLDNSLATRRFSADVVAGFAGVALLLASIGIYGVLAYMVGQRSREIGVRMALGAGRGKIVKLILGRGVMLSIIGIVAGIVFSLSAASLIARLVYGIRPHDPAIFVAMPLLLFGISVLASFLPAWRATKVDPMVALREG